MKPEQKRLTDTRDEGARRKSYRVRLTYSVYVDAADEEAAVVEAERDVMLGGELIDSEAKELRR